MRSRLLMFITAFCLFACNLDLRLAHAQVPLGEILGTVRDQTEATVPDVAVTLKNELTGVQQNTTSNSAGDYVFLYLNPGTYELTVTKQGFHTQVFPHLNLQVEQKMRVDAGLVIGQVNEEIQVTGKASNLDTDTFTVGDTLSSREVLLMPLDGREFSQLAVLMPGVRSTGTTGGALGVVFATSIAVGGTSSNKNAYNVDGVDNTFNVWEGPALNPSIDSIQEFRIDKSGFSAEYGRGGSEVSVVTKSGTNQFHGSAYDFLRNGAVDAGNYVTHVQDALHRNQYGATLSGPIRKDKAFFFGSWEGERQLDLQQEQGSVFSQNMREGDLTATGVTIVDPQTGQQFVASSSPQSPNFNANCTSASGCPNMIPTSRLDQVSLAYMNAMMPTATLPGTASNLIRATNTNDKYDQYIARIDYRLSQNNNLFIRADEEHRTGLPVPIDANSIGAAENFKFWNAGVGFTRTWSPHVLTETRFGWHRESLLIADLPLTASQIPSLAIQGFGSTPIPQTQLPIVSISPVYDFAEWNYPLGFTQGAYELIQNVSLVEGKHTLKIGGDLRKQFLNKPLSNQFNVDEGFSGLYTGSGVADFLLGLPSTASEALNYVPREQRYGDYSAFVQDDWKIARSLTLNLGLRYEIATLPSEVHDLWGTFDTSNQKMVVAGNSVNLAAANPVLLQAYAGLIVPATQTNLPIHTLAFGDHNNFAPRVGFAWSPFHDNKTVVRGGYGIFYVLSDGNIDFNETNAKPYGGSVSATNTAPAPTFTFENPFSGALNAAPLPTDYFLDPHARTPYLQQTTFGVERLLPWHIVDSINLQDQNSKKLEDSWNLNQPPPGGVGPVQSRRPYPQYGSPITGTFHDGYSRYDSGEFQLKKQSTHYTFDWSHTWAKELGRTSVVDPFHKDIFYGQLDLPPNVDKLNFVMDLPFGRGMRWGGNSGKMLDTALGGWVVSGIFTLYQSGDPLTMTVDSDPANVGAFGVAHPNRVCSGQLSHPTMKEWFNPACFVAPTPGTFGDSGTGIVLGPSQRFYDLGIYKVFPITERFKLQFRTEMFNAFNHPNLPNPVTDFSAGALFGVITSKNQVPRVIQFALRLDF